MSDSYDYAVIGSGPGGYVSAIRASQLGLKSVVIEKAEVGGVCLNWGCIPTKALLESGHLLHKVKKGRFGLEGEVRANFSEVIQRSRQIANRLSKGIEFLLKKYDVTLVKGRARFESPKKLIVTGEEGEKSINARNITIATGARARELPHLNFSDNVLSYREAMVLDKQPGSLLVIGAGAIGCEFADFYQCLGTKVTLVEVADHILPVEEESLAKELKSSLEKKGCKVLPSSEVTALSDNGSEVSAKIKTPSKEFEETYDKCLLAVGIIANTEEIGLEQLGVKLDKGIVPTNEFCQIERFNNIFAIGDCAGGKQLAHKASREGMIAAEKAAGKEPRPLSMADVPSCTYTSPQVASVGYSATELKEKGIAFKEGLFPFSALGRALAAGEQKGFAKVYFNEKTGELLGAHLVGHEVTELISNIALGRGGELTVNEFLLTVFPHPTMSESLHEAFGQALGESPNI